MMLDLHQNGILEIDGSSVKYDYNYWCPIKN